MLILFNFSRVTALMKGVGKEFSRGAWQILGREIEASQEVDHHYASDKED